MLSEWLNLGIQTGYGLTGIIGAIGYLGQIRTLIRVYRYGGTETDVSPWAYAWWALGSTFYVLYAIWLIGKPLMIFVSCSALLLNLSTLLLVMLIRRKHKQSIEGNSND